MNKEDKELLIKDLSARLPYEVICHIRYKTGESSYGELTPLDIKWFLNSNIESIKPYLRSIESMTEKEKTEVSKLGVCYDGAFHNDIYDVGIGMEEAFTVISWLLERHFDINYLIQKGLALEAPEGMYKIE